MKTNWCRYCKGTTRITYRAAGMVQEHDCTSCNGTGIDGDPQYAFWMIVGCAVLFCAVVAYALS